MRWALKPVQQELGTPPTSPTSSRATGRGPMREQRERESSMCHERSGRTSPKRAGAALSLHHQGRPCGSPVLRSGALSWHLSTCGTNETDFSLSSLHSDQGRHGGCRLGWALGPSSLASPAPSLSFISAPSKLERLLKSGSAGRSRCGLGWALGPSSLVFSASPSLSFSLSFSLIGPLPTESGRPLKSGSAWRWNCGQGWALGPYSLPSPVSLGPPPY